MGLGDRQTIGDGIEQGLDKLGDDVEDGLDKLGDDHYQIGIAALDRVEKWFAKYDLRLSLDLKKPYGVRFGLEPKA